MPRESMLNGTAYKFQKLVFAWITILEFLIELRSEHLQKLDIPRDKWSRRIRGLEDDGVARCSANHRTAEVSFQRLSVIARLYQFDAHRIHPRSRALSRNGEHPRKTVLDEYCGFNIHSEQPAELDRPLVPYDLVQDFFRRCQLLIPRHVMDRC